MVINEEDKKAFDRAVEITEVLVGMGGGPRRHDATPLNDVVATHACTCMHLIVYSTDHAYHEE